MKLRRGNVGPVTTAKIIEDHNAVAHANEMFSNVGADKARASSYEGNMCCGVSM